MKNKWKAAGIGSLILAAGCSPTVDQTEEEVIVVEETEEEAQEIIITPTMDTPDNYYRNVLEDGTYIRGDARGSVAHAMNNRIDIDQFEIGLMEIASGIFSPEDYYFQEGTHLDGDLLNSWLRRYSPEDEDEDGEETEESAGLNPQLADEENQEDAMREAPLVLSNIMEHNYYTENGDDGVELSGAVIGISVRSVYYFRTENEDGSLNFFEEPVDEEYALDYAEEAAGEMLERLRTREEFADIPITFAVFMEEPRGSINPGTFHRIAESGAGDTELTGWETISENNFVFPSNEAGEANPALSDQFSQFEEDINNFFDYPVGVVGNGRYKDGSLEEMKIEINLQSHGQAEVIALAQYISSILEDSFQSQAPVYVYLNSVEGSEALVLQYPGESPTMHVYK
ncbi:CamS family sex pheromone protein [Alkalicoccus halolimnae]|uniref:CamS family sex pheromone protein n=1 Tax=Alkalicoccus halolimnae TaxID=1667239 RepID=A0A5C7FFN5_9BACI|nr:CamS family sex pheromone protein [Alkalicoccus halolimnae]TXF85044.1 CamS family sex pheromone protein [Alkalicoccus halolimnae]